MMEIMTEINFWQESKRNIRLDFFNEDDKDGNDDKAEKEQFQP